MNKIVPRKALVTALFAALALPSSGQALSEETQALLDSYRSRLGVKGAPVTEKAEAATQPAPAASAEKPVAAAPLVAVAKPAEDVVHLRNGDRLSGKLLSVDEKSLRFAAHGNAAISIPWSDVVRLRTVDPYRTTLKKGSALEAPFVASEKGDVFRVRTELGPIELPKKEIAKVESFADIAARAAKEAEERKFHLRKVWSGKLGLGYAETSGNSVARNINTVFEATRKTSADKLFLDAQYNRTVAGDVRSADLVRGGMRLDVNTTPSNFYFLFGRLEIDKIQDLDLRTTVGAGLGHTYYDRPGAHLDLGWGFTYVRDNYEAAPTNSDVTFLTSLNWNRKTGANSSFSERLLYYPNVSEFSDFRIESDTKFDYALSDNLSLSIGVVNRFDNTPNAGKKKNDLTVTTSITRKF